jgi:hypothetical protein
MNYFTARRAEGCFRALKSLSEEYWRESPDDNRTHQDIAAGLARRETEKSRWLREQIAQMISEADTLANEMGLDVTVQTLPPPPIGGPILPVNMLRAIIDPRCGHGTISRERIEDTLNLCTGAAQAWKRRARWTTFNPVYWLIALLAFVLRIPFLILRQAGVPRGVEENICAHLIKTLLMVGAIALMAYLGLERHIGELVKAVKW